MFIATVMKVVGVFVRFSCATSTKSMYQGIELGLRMEHVRCLGEDRLSGLLIIRKIYGHCNVPLGYSENSSWLLGSKQRTQYRLHLEEDII
jgi:hypothetical protein